METMYLDATEHLTLNALMRKHAELGLIGRCIVKFDPALYETVCDLPSFMPIDFYRYTKPVDPEEIGAVRIFHMVPNGPIEYSKINIS